MNGAYFFTNVQFGKFLPHFLIQMCYRKLTKCIGLAFSPRLLTYFTYAMRRKVPPRHRIG